MLMSVNASFNDASKSNARILIRANTDFPAEWAKLYRKNVIPLTPKKSSALRRSIVTRITEGQAEVTWRSKYAAAQNAGQHTVHEKRVVKIGDRFVTLKPGVYRHKIFPNGGGPKFANLAFAKTNREVPALLRQLGLTK